MIAILAKLIVHLSITGSWRELVAGYSVNILVVLCILLYRRICNLISGPILALFFSLAGGFFYSFYCLPFYIIFAIKYYLYYCFSAGYAQHTEVPLGSTLSISMAYYLPVVLVGVFFVTVLFVSSLSPSDLV
jgi:hypothetical protein